MVDPKRSKQEWAEYPGPLEEKQWVRQVREKGDRKAFEKVFRTYYKPLYHFAYGYVGAEAAEDVIQGVFLRIWARREYWDPPGTVKQYLFAAVRNEALNVLRRRQVEGDAEETVTRILKELHHEATTEETLQAEELRRAIEQGIDRLPPRCREIFLLNRRSGLTYTEIADTLDLSLSTVNTQMGRALKSLQKHLVDFIPFFVVVSSVVLCDPMIALIF